MDTARAEGTTGRIARTIRLSDLDDHLRQRQVAGGAPCYAWAREKIAAYQASEWRSRDRREHGRQDGRRGLRPVYLRLTEAASTGVPEQAASTGAEEGSGNRRLAILLAMAMFVLVVDTSLMNVSISAVRKLRGRRSEAGVRLGRGGGRDCRCGRTAARRVHHHLSVVADRILARGSRHRRRASGGSNSSATCRTQGIAG